MANTFVQVYNGGDNGANITALTTTTHSFTSGNTVAFPVRWGQGSGGTTRTISTVTCSSGETCTIVTGTDRESTTGVWAQWVVVAAMSGTSSRTFTATLSGQATHIEIPFLIEFSGTNASPVGNVAIGGNAFGDPQEVTITGVTANSTILWHNSANDPSGTQESGTVITQPTSPFTGEGDVPRAGYLTDAGAAGSKTVGYSGGTTGVWSITAIEIKTVAGGGAALGGSASTTGIGTQASGRSIGL